MGASRSLLAEALKRLEEAQTGPAASAALAVLISGLEDTIKGGHIEEAVAAIVTVIRREHAIPAEMRSQYNIALNRVFARDTLRRAAGLLLDPLYSRDALELLTRAGAAGTEELLSLLVQAPTFAERRALLHALRGMKHGTELLVNMLGHPEWYVVRNVADLSGELRLEAATDQLANAAEHTDGRVRRSAGAALAKIGTARAARHLRKVLRDANLEVRLEAAKAIGGTAVAGLPAILSAACDAETDLSVRTELFRALGRIGTAEAVQVLMRAAEPGGWVFGRKPPAARLAAIDGLALAGGQVAVATLRALTKDADKEVRAAAVRALPLAAKKQAR